MKYSKPELIKLKGKLPPITTNFAPPPVEQPTNPDDPSPVDPVVYPDFLKNGKQNGLGNYKTNDA